MSLSVQSLDIVDELGRQIPTARVNRGCILAAANLECNARIKAECPARLERGKEGLRRGSGLKKMHQPKTGSDNDLEGGVLSLRMRGALTKQGALEKQKKSEKLMWTIVARLRKTLRNVNNPHIWRRKQKGCESARYLQHKTLRKHTRSAKIRAAFGNESARISATNRREFL
jgi:hypothetical protein